MPAAPQSAKVDVGYAKPPRTDRAFRIAPPGRESQPLVQAATKLAVRARPQLSVPGRFERILLVISGGCRWRRRWDRRESSRDERAVRDPEGHSRGAARRA